MKAFPQILKASIPCYVHSVDSHHLTHRFYTTMIASRTKPSFIGTKRDPSLKGGSTSSRAPRRSSRHDIVFAVFCLQSHTDNRSSFKIKTATKMKTTNDVFVRIPPLRLRKPSFYYVHRIPDIFPFFRRSAIQGIGTPKQCFLSSLSLRLYMDTGLVAPQSSVLIQHSQRGKFGIIKISFQT